ncbi:MAG: pyridoxamine 5'-phosphate oxidase family protein [Cocleimonas sp.]|nr:pyridoxamine 5'-phosphate oxidase family protein [Cocleimonas sp.]
MKQSPEDALSELQQTAKSLFLSTLTTNGKPNGSYAPFIMDDAGNFYIFVSQLASHTQDLLDNPQSSILLAEDEQNSRQIFARKRASYYCHCRIIEKEDPSYESLLDLFEIRFSNIISLLRTLPDFTLFKLEVQSGSFVQGFGKAYEITKNGLIHKDPS